MKYKVGDTVRVKGGCQKSCSRQELVGTIIEIDDSKGAFPYLYCLDSYYWYAESKDILSSDQSQYYIIELLEDESVKEYDENSTTHNPLDGINTNLEIIAQMLCSIAHNMVISNCIEQNKSVSPEDLEKIKDAIRPVDDFYNYWILKQDAEERNKTKD